MPGTAAGVDPGLPELVTAAGTGFAIVYASTVGPVARKSFPSEAAGVAKWSIEGVLWVTTACPVCGFSPYRVPWFQSVAHTRPPAMIGGPLADPGTCQPVRVEKVPAVALSASTWSPFEQVT